MPDNEDLSPECLIGLDALGRIRRWDAAAQAVLGWDGQEALDKPLGALLMDASTAQAFEDDLRRHRDGVSWKFLGRVIDLSLAHRDGRQVPAQCCAWPAGDGDARGIAFSVRDVTAHHQAREALRRSEAHYRAVVEHLGEGMVVIQDERIVFANPQAAEILRAAIGELMGMRAIELLHPEDRAGVAQRLARRQAAEPLAARTEIRRLDDDGGVRWLETHSTNATWEGRPATMSFFSDITQRKAVVEALHRSEERYRAVVEHVDDGMVVVKDQRFVFVNPRAAEIAQMTVPDMLREGYLHRIHPEDRAIVDERRRRRLAGEEVPNRYEIRLLLPDGTVRWIDIGVTIVPWDGESGTLTFFSDVTDRKVLEAQLKSTLQERETILQSSIVGIAFLTPDGRFRWANDAMLQIFGARDGRERLVSIESIYESREEYLRVGGMVAERISKGEGFETELRLRRLDGSLLWASLSGKAVNKFDLSQGTVWVVMDITRRKELEEALLKTSSEREAILNSALVGIVLSVARRHVWVNQKFAEMLGYTREELIGQSTAVIHPDHEAWERLGMEQREAFQTHGTFTHERQLRRRNGEVFWVQMAGRCIRDRDPDAGVIWTFLDITERRQAEDDTRAALHRQSELNELRSRFVSMTSHEFRTPLATILSSAELLKFYDDRLPSQERREIIDTIESGVQRMTGMLERVLQIGRAEARMLEFRPRALDLVPLCARLVLAARSQHPDTRCTIVQELPEQALEGSFDEQLLGHIISNLLSNALKYSPHGGEVRLRLLRDGDKVVIEVCDQGIGIPPAEIAHLFGSFHRASNVGDIQGTGLGLAIVKNSVDLHGGAIDVRSTPGQGSCFTVRI